MVYCNYCLVFVLHYCPQTLIFSHGILLLGIQKMLKKKSVSMTWTTTLPRRTDDVVVSIHNFVDLLLFIHVTYWGKEGIFFCCSNWFFLFYRCIWLQNQTGKVGKTIWLLNLSQVFTLKLIFEVCSNSFLSHSRIVSQLSKNPWATVEVLLNLAVSTEFL